MFLATLISALIIIAFFSLGWVSAQRIFTWTKLIGVACVICIPITVIWWIMELIGWPTSLFRLSYPFLVLWIPYFAGNLIHQFLYFVSRQAED